MDIENTEIEKNCRICLSEEYMDNDLMSHKYISPCKCKGTSQYIHILCLR